MIATGLDRLLARPEALAGRRWGLLAHAASVSAEMVPAHLALAAAATPPVRLFGPEHGFYGVEQDMVAASDAVDPWTGARIASLYGADEGSLVPAAAAFAGLDLLVIDLQDIGTRYYTYAATAVWAAEVALAAGCEVWLLDRPNPLGGVAVEGNLPLPGFDSFVGAFRLPVRHGLTLGELTRLEARRRGWDAAGLTIWQLEGWRRDQAWEAIGRPWIAPSPNMPSPVTAWLYPGACLIEATEFSEGRGTTRPFQLVGAPGIDPRRLVAELRALAPPGVACVPTYFKPGFQKHAGAVCGGVELVITDLATLRPLRLGVDLLLALVRAAPEQFIWRRAPYEFVSDRPAIDLLTGSAHCREALALGEGGGAALAGWVSSWTADEAAFRAERQAVMLYPE